MDSIEAAMDIGRSNREAMTLLANHCLHADVDLRVSMVGRMAELPIGPAEIRCQHAPFFGMSAVDLMSLAVEFYEQNCTQCPHRKPSGAVPTIATEAARRAALLDEVQSQAVEREREDHEAWAARKQRRETAVLGQPYTVRDLADHIAAMDVEPGSAAEDGENETTANARLRVRETARRAPELFGEALAETVVVLAESLDPTAHAVLRALAEGGVVPRERVAAMAARALARSALPEAGQTVAAFSDVLTEDDAASACPGAIQLASQPDRFGPSHWAAEPQALLALARVSWTAVRAAVLDALDSDDAWLREAGAHGARCLLREDATRVEDFGEALVRAIRGADRGYAGEPSPDGSSARALAQAWLSLPQATRAVIEDLAPSLEDNARKVLMNVPRLVLSDDGPSEEGARREAVEFLVRRLDGGWGDDSSNEASDDLRWVARDTPAALVPEIDTLVGALMRECAPRQTTSVLLPRTSRELDVLEKRTAEIRRGRRRTDLSETLGHLGQHSPEPVLQRVFALLDATTGDEALDTRTRAALIELLEHAVSGETVARILPRLYTHLLSDDQVVRAASIELWQACARVAATLPDDLGVLVPSLLRDRFAIVHGAMARVVPSLGLADAVARTLLDPLFSVAAAYRAKGNDILRDALRSMLWAAETADEETRRQAALMTIDLCATLSANSREDILLHYALIEYRSTASWAEAAMQCLADAARSEFVVSPRDEPLLAALLDEPRGLARVPIQMFHAVSDLHVPRSVAQAAETIEVLQAAARWRDALQFATGVAAAVPDTEEYRSRREWFSSVVAATAVECAVSEGLHHECPVQGDADETADARSRFGAHIRARAAARAALAELAPDDPGAAADAVARAADLMEQTPGGDRRVSFYVQLLSVARHLLRYDAAVRAASDTDAAASLAAARRTATVLDRATRTSLSADDPIRRFAVRARSASADDLDDLLASAAAVPLALPLCDDAFRRPRRGNPQETTSAASRIRTDVAFDGQPTAVCVLEMNGNPVFDVQVLRDERVHDLTVDIRLQEWPEWAHACRVQLLSTLPPDVLVVPTFEFRAHDARADEHGVRLSQTGTFMFRSTRPPGAEPLDLPLHVQFSSADGRRKLALIGGYQRLRVRPYDPSRDVLTEHSQMDQRLLEMYAELYDDPALDPDDVEAFCRFFTACVRAAQRIMFDTTFLAGKKVTETQFHDALEERLRHDPALQGRLTRRDSLAGGFDDLLHDDVVAELKVEKQTPRSVEDCARYIGQPTQYGVGRGSRLSTLVVLDHTKKTAPPAVLENHIGWMYPAQHGFVEPRYPSRVGVLIINTNWPVPSAWSRRRIATRV